MSGQPARGGGWGGVEWKMVTIRIIVGCFVGMTVMLVTVLVVEMLDLMVMIVVVVVVVAVVCLCWREAYL